MSWITHYLSLILFAVLAVALFSGYPVAFVLGGIAFRLVNESTAGLRVGRDGRQRLVDFVREASRHFAHRR